MDAIFCCFHYQSFFFFQSHGLVSQKDEMPKKTSKSTAALEGNTRRVLRDIGEDNVDDTKRDEGLNDTKMDTRV